MLIDWFKLSGALLLLLTPIRVLHSSRVRYRHIDRDWDQHWQQAATLGTNWIDLLRAMLGAWLLLEAISPAANATGLMRHAPFLIRSTVLIVGTLLQTIICKEVDAFNAPYAYAAGFVAGLFQPAIAFFSILLAVALTLGSRKPTAFLPMLVMSLVPLGILFSHKKAALDLAAAGTAILLPWLLTAMFHRDFVAAYRTRRRTEPPSQLR